MRRKFC